MRSTSFEEQRASDGWHSRSADLVVGVRLSADEMRVDVAGELDLATTSTLRGALDAAVQDGVRRVVVDLGGVTFLGVAGARVLLEHATRVQGAGGELRLRNVPPGPNRLLGLMDAGHLITNAFDTSTADVLAHLVAFGEYSAQREIVDAALDVLLVAICDLTGIRGGSITMASPNGPVTTAATDVVAIRLDEVQYVVGDGPCLTAMRQQQQVRVVTTGDDRWPAFLEAARHEDVPQVLSTPLSAGAQPFGALNLYARELGQFDDALAGRLAGVADALSRQLLSSVPPPSPEAIVGRLQAGLGPRDLIARAQGVLLVQQGLGADDAYSHLLQTARSAGVDVADQAAAMIAAAEAANDA